jgi:hypothetical protein
MAVRRRVRTMGSSCEDGNEISGFIKVGNFLISSIIGFTRGAENTVRTLRLEHAIRNATGISVKSGLRHFGLIRQRPRGQTTRYLETN